MFSLFPWVDLPQSISHIMVAQLMHQALAYSQCLNFLLIGIALLYTARKWAKAGGKTIVILEKSLSHNDFAVLGVIHILGAVLFLVLGLYGLIIVPIMALPFTYQIHQRENFTTDFHNPLEEKDT